MTENRKYALSCVMLARQSVLTARRQRIDGAPSAKIADALNYAAFWQRRAGAYMRGEA